MKKASEIFSDLTTFIGPHDHDSTAAWMIGEVIGRDMVPDEHGNYVIEVPGGNEGVVFAAHLDTVAKKWEQPNRTIFKEVPKSYGPVMMTDGTTILGADDRAGCAILCYMILHNVPGTYVFFTGEEAGCIGSSKAAAAGWGDGMKVMVEFDRYGYESIITHQSPGRTASDEFARALAQAYEEAGLPGLKPDPGGVYTDSAQFAEIIPECTNISVGYFDQHTKKERQDLGFLDMVAEASSKIDWNKLPVKRDPKNPANKRDYGHSGYYGTYDWYDDYGSRGYRGYKGSSTYQRALTDPNSMLSERLAAASSKYGSARSLMQFVLELDDFDAETLKDALWDLVKNEYETVAVALLYTYPDALINHVEEIEYEYADQGNLNGDFDDEGEAHMDEIILPTDEDLEGEHIKMN